MAGSKDKGSNAQQAEQAGEKTDLEARSPRMIALEVTIFSTFTIATIMHQYLSNQLFEHYETQMSVQQSFELLSSNIKDRTENDMEHFWLWINTLRISTMTLEEETGYYKIANSPDYVISDFHITTRRMKMKSNEMFPEIQQWVTTHIDPFTDVHSDEFFDTEPFVIDATGTLAEHDTDHTYRELGGFAFTIPLDQSIDDFVSQVDYLKNESEFMAPGTVSAICDILFYNQVMQSFVYVALKAERTPAGFTKYDFEYHKPIGQLLDSKIHFWLVFFEYFTIFLIMCYLALEIYVMIRLILDFFAEKGLKKEKEQQQPGSAAGKSQAGGQSGKGAANKETTFEAHIMKILSLHPDASGGKVVSAEGEEGADPKGPRLVKFYWDEINKVGLMDGPSFMNALKTVLRRDQRLIMYIVMILLIPINSIHGQWHEQFETVLDLQNISFIDIIQKDSEWRQTHSDHFVLNTLLSMTDLDDRQFIYMTVFLFFVILRMINLIAKHIIKGLTTNLRIIEALLSFLSSFIITLLFVVLAWSQCQHILFGNNMEAYATPIQSFISSMMLALRDFTFLDGQYEKMPNITLLFFIFFLISIIYYLANIFVSLVLIVYEETVDMYKKKEKTKIDELLKAEHWSYKVRSVMQSIKKKCNSESLKKCAKCCKKKKGESDDPEDIINEGSKVTKRRGTVKLQESQLKKLQDNALRHEDGNVDLELIQDIQNDENLDPIEKQELLDKARNNPDNQKELTRKERAPQVDVEDVSNEDVSKPSGQSESGSGSGSNRSSESAEDKGEGDEDEQDLSNSQVLDENGFPIGDATPMFSGVQESEGKDSIISEYIEDENESRPSLRVSDSDMSDDDPKLEPSMDLVKSKVKQQKKGQQALSFAQRTPEETRLLQSLNWNKDFEVYDLNADLQQDSRHTSNKQDAFMVKQREQRCGKVIWTTLLQLIYMFLYLYLIMSRYHIPHMYAANDDIEEIIWRHKFKLPEKYSDGFIEVYIDELYNADAFLYFLEDFENQLVVKQEATLVTGDAATESTGTTIPLYYLQDNKNYIVLQGMTYCASFLYDTFEDGEIHRKQYTTEIDFQKEIDSYKFQSTYLEGTGGYCFAFFFGEDRELPHVIFSKLMENLKDQAKVEIEIEKLHVSLAVAEPAKSMLTVADMKYDRKEDGLQTITFYAVSEFMKIEVMTLGLMVIFLLFFLFNLYLNLSNEFNIFQRYTKWKEHNIKPLSKIEKDQRELVKPSWARQISILFRSTNIVYLAHIALTAYSEAIYLLSFVELTNLTGILQSYPTAPVRLDETVLNAEELGTTIARQAFHLETEKQLHTFTAAVTTYRRIAFFNLFLILVLPLQSASQSIKFRAFLVALSQTIMTSLELLLIFFLFSLAGLFYGLHSFGWEARDFKDLQFAAMTFFKMTVGRFLGQYYRVVIEISLYKAVFFTLPIILMKSVFATVFLAVVAFQYEREVLNKDFSSNINLLRSVFFCNISLDKRQQNKRAKQLKQSEDMQKLDPGKVLGEGGDEKDGEDEIKLGEAVDQDAVKPVNGGLEIYNKMDIKFTIQGKIPEWAMACADEIRQEFANRKNLRVEAIKLAQKLFHKGDGGQANAKINTKRLEQHQTNSFNLMVARKEYLQYIWFGIQFLYMQGELIQKVIESTENEIKTMLRPYYHGDQKLKLLELIEREDASGAGRNPARDLWRGVEVTNPITNRKELLTREHLTVDTLYEQEEIQSEVKAYLLLIMQEVEERLQRIRKQWKTLQMQNKQTKILRALISRESLFEYGR